MAAQLSRKKAIREARFMRRRRRCVLFLAVAVVIFTIAVGSSGNSGNSGNSGESNGGSSSNSELGR